MNRDEDKKLFEKVNWLYNRLSKEEMEVLMEWVSANCDTVRLSTLEEVQREMRLLITKWRNDPSVGKFAKEKERFNTYLGFIIQKVNERIEELKQRGKEQ